MRTRTLSTTSRAYRDASASSVRGDASRASAARAPLDNGDTRPEACARSGRRDALVAGTLSLSAAASLAAALAAPRSARAEEKRAFVKDPSFYGRWSYAEPADIVPFVEATAARGDAAAVLAAMDEFGQYYPMYKLGDEKGRILAQLVRDRAPRNSVEVGTFLGYSAIWTATNLPPGGALTCVEFEPRHVAVARALTSYAGVSDRVEILQGSGSERVPDVVRKLGKGTPADMVFFDHCKECYLPDLMAFENAGLVAENTVVVADNVVYPGAPDFLDYVDTSRGRYRTELLDAAFEYDQVWKKDWVPQRDALSFSTRLADAPN